MEEATELTEQLKNQNRLRAREKRLLELKRKADKDGYFPTLLTPKQIASRLNIHVDTTRKAIREGKMKGYDISDGKKPDYRSTTMDVLEYITRKDPTGIARILKQRQIELKIEELTDFEGLIKKYQKLAGARRSDQIPKA